MDIKYKMLAGRLEDMIEKQMQQGIQKMPTEQEIGTRYRVSRQTVRMALHILEEKGLIERRQGSGAFITGKSARSSGNTISILVFSDQDYIYPGVLHDITSVLDAEGFRCQVYSTDNRIIREREILQQLVINPPRGIIVEGCKSALPNPNLDLYYSLKKTGCRIVFLFNCYPALSDVTYVKDDNYYGSSLLVHHLTEQGHTAIGGIFKSDDMQGTERYQGFVETMRDQNLPVPDERICWYDSCQLDNLLKKNDSGFLKNMLINSLSDCTAVVCYNDIIAYHLIDELKLAGYRLPEDMAITAFDNTYLSNANILTVTTLSHKPHEMGTKAAKTMLSLLKGLPALPQEAPWKLNLKESTQSGI